MEIVVNGKTRSVADGMTVTALLEVLDLPPEGKGIAVAINAEVVGRTAWHSTRLNEGDRVDVIRAVQGG